MKTIFLIAMIVYLLVFIGIGIMDLKKVKTFEDYAVAGRRQGLFAVIMTLLATVIGASTTIGITDTVNQIGFPGFWWLAFGGVGLVLQSIILSEKVRGIGADTLPDLAKKTVGSSAEIILALIIVISWIGVIASQLVAMNGIITFATGKSSTAMFIIVSVIVIAYTMVGGQMSVVKTDRIQFIIILVGIIISCIYLYAVKGGDTASVAHNIEFINESYRPIKLLNQFFVIGGVYFLGPDIMSRNFISKDEKTAKKSALIAGLCLFVFATIITLVGMWVRYNVTPEELADNKALMYVIGLLPMWLGVILVFGLLSAILSSTDTCIINASSIFVKDILKKDSVVLVRITVAVLGIIAMIVAISGRGDIIGILSNAYSVYTPGVIFPLFVAIMAYKKKGIIKPVWILAVVLGGLFGISGAYFGAALASLNLPAPVMENFSLIGMGVSLVVALLSVKWNGNIEE